LAEILSDVLNDFLPKVQCKNPVCLVMTVWQKSARLCGPDRNTWQANSGLRTVCWTVKFVCYVSTARSLVHLRHYVFDLAICLHVCVCACPAEAFSNWLAINFQLLFLYVSWKPLMCELCFYSSELELYFGSAAAAAAAAESLCKVRDGIEVAYGQSLSQVDSNTARKF